MVADTSSWVGCDGVGSWWSPCSRNARPEKALVGRAHSETNQLHPPLLIGWGEKGPFDGLHWRNHVAYALSTRGKGGYRWEP